MKSEHRHELKTNELAHWLQNLPEWTKNNQKAVILGVSLIAAVILLFTWSGMQEDIQEENMADMTGALSTIRQMPLAAALDQMNYTTIVNQTREDLKNALKNSSGPRMEAMALIKTAQINRMDMHLSSNPDQQQLSNSIETAVKQLEKASEKAAGYVTLAAAARFETGLCREELGNFEQAEQIYSDLASDELLNETAAAISARERLKSMEAWSQKVSFPAPPEKPAPQEPAMDIMQQSGMELPADIMEQIPQQTNPKETDANQTAQ